MSGQERQRGDLNRVDDECDEHETRVGGEEERVLVGERVGLLGGKVNTRRGREHDRDEQVDDERAHHPAQPDDHRIDPN